MTFLKITSIGRTYRHVQRYRQILMVLIKYGFGDLVDTLKIEQYLEIGRQMISRKRREKIEKLSRAVRVRMVLEELGPTFIKLGQILSTRPDLLPVAFIREFPKLQDEVPPFAFSEVADIIETEFKQPLHALFLKFDAKPLAAASIGQVHRARLKDGQQVVVKIQRPGIRRTIEVDLEIMMHLAGLMEKHLKGWEIQRPTKIVAEFARTLGKELDYTLEAANMERFGRHFAKDSRVYIPKVYRQVSTGRVLTMECVSGIKASDIERLAKAGLDRRKIARRGFDLIMKQVFIYGFFHADPHPGNIFVLPANVICYLDFGMIGRIDLKTREMFADLIMALVHLDETKVTHTLLKLTQYEQAPELKDLEKDAAEFMDRYCYRPLKEIDLGKLLHQLLDVASKHRLTIPPDLFLMMKALSTVEGLGRTLDPDFDVIRQAAPFIRRVQLNRVNPYRLASDAAHSGMELVSLLKDIPGELREIMKMVKRGQVKIEFEHRGLGPLISTFDRLSNRIAFSIVLASLVIGSSLVVLAGIPPKWHEIPVIGIVGFLVAGAMAFWLLISIMRSGRM